jgi:PAS domain S-box-containing protein
MTQRTDLSVAAQKAEHVSQLSPRRQFMFYLQFVYRYLFGGLVLLYAHHYGVTEGWLSFQGAVVIILGHSIGTTACLLAARRRSRARQAQNFQLFFDLCVLAFGLPLDPNQGLPLLFVFYLAFLDLGVRYGFYLYRRQAYSAMVALAIAIYIRAFQTTGGFSLLDAWAVLLFVAIMLYGLQVFAVRERTFRALKEAQARLQLSLGAPGICTWDTDNPLQVLKPGENFERVVGIKPELFSDRMADYIAQIHADDRTRVVGKYSQFVREPLAEYEDEYRINSLDGTERTVNVRARAERDARGHARYISGILWDISEQVRQRESLAQMEERYRLTTQSARVGVWVWNIGAGNFEIDSSMSEVFGFPPLPDKQAPMRVVALQEFMARIHPDDFKRMMQEGVSVLKSDKPEYFQEYRIRLSSGQIRGIQSRGVLFRDAAGKVVRAAGVIWDATELMEARNALERKTEELERKTDELERANRELDDFSYTASHDLKEPLRGISNYAQFLQEDYSARLDEKGQSMLLKMREQAKRMETLITELLNVARLSRAPFHIEDTDLQSTLAGILASLEFSIREKSVEIRVPRPLPRLCCDRVRAGELLRNLITNGVKYNDKPERWLEIGYDGPVSEPIFYVRDNGIGIKPEYRDQVFSLFQRLHTREAFGGGTGVGLTIAQKIVEMHGGRIWIESLPNIGTTFYFTLGKGTPS